MKEWNQEARNAMVDTIINKLGFEDPRTIEFAKLAELDELWDCDLATILNIMLSEPVKDDYDIFEPTAEDLKEAWWEG